MLGQRKDTTVGRIRAAWIGDGHLVDKAGQHQDDVMDTAQGTSDEY